ncbi:alpha/beta hydrolase [Naasia lichenicola]|uniref:Alpha/beta hydrolase n=1 Tax=Naasia lichenicola TaxID=2565933 RepID=A0A4V3WTE5_9MICO|nr:alpha/beta hydrolase [Naasia lichenicola]THG31717.1 alpha/beta hydrolase [Naasia lichenicola]
MSIEIRGGVELPAVREDIELHTSDGLTLVGELSTPYDHPPVATLLTLHPLPTAGGFMDSHILRKAAARLPALADLAVLRFNTRGTSSPRGTSEGEFGHGTAEAADLEAAWRFLESRALPHVWIVGWSFGTEIALKFARAYGSDGVILLSPPLHRASDEDVAAWAHDARPVIALVPEHDDFLQPTEARERFAVAPNIEVIDVPGAKHLWVGENYTRRVLDEIVARTNPSALPLPTAGD